VSSNFTIANIIDQSEECNVFGKDSNKQALQRRFWQCNVGEMLRLLGVKLLPRYEINMLKKQGNTDPKKLFMSYDYIIDTPTGEELKTPEEYQQLIKDTYYGK
jgi:hypothetical protein